VLEPVHALIADLDLDPIAEQGRTQGLAILHRLFRPLTPDVGEHAQGDEGQHQQLAGFVHGQRDTTENDADVHGMNRIQAALGLIPQPGERALLNITHQGLEFLQREKHRCGQQQQHPAKTVEQLAPVEQGKRKYQDEDPMHPGKDQRAGFVFTGEELDLVVVGGNTELVAIVTAHAGRS